MPRRTSQRIAMIALVSLFAGIISGALSLTLLAPDQASLISASPTTTWIIHLAISLVGGFIFLQLFSRHPIRYAEYAMSGIVYGVLMWIIVIVLLPPLLRGEAARWTVEAAAATLPLLITLVLTGGFIGIGSAIINQYFPAPQNPHSQQPSSEAVDPVQVVIIGGGFAGVEAAQVLENLAQRRNRDDIHITLVSKSNHLLFTPMLTEVVSGGVEGQHITPPLRTFFNRVTTIRGEPVDINLDSQHLDVLTSFEDTRTLAYDHLVLATGAVPNYFGNANLEQYTLPFKSLADALHIRNHIIAMLEQADSEPDPDRRKALLTFVVVGGGFAGVELVGGMNDFVRGSRWYYPNINPEEINLLLVHAGDVILPELSTSLGQYARRKMEERGVTFYLNARMSDATPTAAYIGDVRIPSQTIIWTAGNIPNPLGKSLGLPVNKQGGILVDDHLQVHDHPNIWAIGDVAVVPDVVTGDKAPPTAQYASREGKTVAHNLYAAITGEVFKPFKHRSLGSLAVVGHQSAVAEIRGLQFSGLFAFLIWRAIYLGKLPTFEKKVRVTIDWLVDLFFPRDITYTETEELAPHPAQPHHTTVVPEAH